jgi:hypothetical protein
VLVFYVQVLDSPQNRVAALGIREIVDLALLTKPDNVATLVHGGSFSFGDSGGFGHQPRYAALLKP